ATVSTVRLPTIHLEAWPEPARAPTASARLERADDARRFGGGSRTIEDQKMNTFNFARAARAALIAAASCGPSTAVLADIKDYKFELVDQSVQTGSGQGRSGAARQHQDGQAGTGRRNLYDPPR